MPTTTTPRTALPLLAAAQAQKHVTHNYALLQLDALLFARFLDRDLTAPPASPADGDTYLIAATATGDWAGKDGQIAYASDGAWRFAAPFTGLAAFVVDEAKLIVFTGSAWADYASILSLQNVPLLGVNTTADATNKLAAKSAAILFDNAGAGVQAKLNKLAAGDTASLLYQTNYSGRAEIGLAGDDDFHFKVSPDGATWFESIRIDRTSGAASVDLGLSAGGVAFGGASGGTPAQDASHFFWDTANHRLGLGAFATAPQAALSVNNNTAATFTAIPVGEIAIHCVHADNVAPVAVLGDAYGTSATQSSGVLFRRAHGTNVAPSALISADRLAYLIGTGWDGAAYRNSASFQFVASQNWSAGTACGTDFQVQLIANGTISRTNKFVVFNDGRCQAAGAACDLSYSKQVPTTGFAVVIPDAVQRLLLDPAGTLATGTITMPAAPQDGQLCRISSTQDVTALTHSPNAGQTLKGALTSLAANMPGGEWIYVAANSTWYRS